MANPVTLTAAKPTFHQSSGNGDVTNRAIVSIVLTALSVVAAYYCLAHGFPMLDSAATTAQYVGSRILCYVGASFVLAATGNMLHMLCKGGIIPGKDSYDMDDARRQAAITLTAPIAMIGVMAFCAITAAANGR